MILTSFKQAKLTPTEFESASKELDELFLGLKANGNKKGLNPKGLKVLEDKKFEVAELIIQLINDQYLLTDPTPLLVQVEDGDIRNNYVWQTLDSNLRVVNRSYGTKPISQRLNFKEFPITTSMKESAVEIPLEELASGRITTSLVTQQMANAIRRYRVGAVLDGINAGVTSGPDRTGLAGYTLRYSGFTQANVDKAIDGLLDESESATMFGRYTAFAPTMRQFPDFLDSGLLGDQMTTRGSIGEYHNATILTLRDQFSKVDASHVISNQRVWLASSTPGAIWMQKDVSFLNWTMLDPRSATFGIGIRLEDGCLVWDPYQYRIIDL